MLTATIRKFEDSNVIGAVIVHPKVFSTGSRGYYGQEKIEIDGKRYQVSIQLVEIGSKNAAKADPTDQAIG